MPALILVLCLSLCGCFSVPNSPSPRFYTLQPQGEPGKPKQLALVSKLIIGIGPVEVPEYQNRPQIVTKDKEGMLTFAQFERWGEPLDMGIARLIMENLTTALPQADLQLFPCNFSIPLNYQVLVNIVQLESRLDKDMLLTAQWTILDAKTKKMVVTRRFQNRQEINPHTYAGIALALSREVTLLTDEISDGLSGIISGTETKDSAVQ